MWKRVWLTYVFLQIDKSARFLDKPVHVEELNAYIAARQQEHQRLKAALGERIDYMSPYQIAAQLRAIAERAGLFPNEIDHLELPGSAHNLENISTTQAKYLLKEIAITLLLIPTIYLSVILLIWIVSGRNPYTTVTTRPTIIDVTPHEPFHSSHTKKRIDKE
ncbi:MAG: hypothetical protein ACREUW_02535 [Burkholderiales bacterium]